MILTSKLIPTSPKFERLLSIQYKFVPSMSNLLDDSLKEQLGDGEDIVIDPEHKPDSAAPVKLNKRQKRKLRKLELQQKDKMKEKTKKERKKEHDRIMLQKYIRRDEIIKNLRQEEMQEDKKVLIHPSSTIGIKKTDKQLYEEALLLKSKNLPYDEELVAKIERKKEKAAQALKNTVYITVDETIKMSTPEAPAVPAVPLIAPDQSAKKTEKPAPVKKEFVPKPSINVQLNRPEGVAEARSQLPIIDKEQEIMEILNNDEEDEYIRDVVVITGETGSGKTTQVPQFIYEAGYGTIKTHGKIAVTEPRRVAAINMSKRVAFEMGFRHGDEVGYQIRNDRMLSPSTVIKFCTDGVLLQELENDYLLSSYSVIVIDEAHERTINTDVLIGMLTRVAQTRRERVEAGDKNVELLKLVIMSATLRVEDFVNNDSLFPKLKPHHIHVEGRTYPVTFQFAAETPPMDQINETIKEFVDHLHEELPPGNILVFVPGKQDIFELVRHFRALPTTASAPKLDSEKTAEERAEEEKDENDGKLEELENFDQLLQGEAAPVVSRKPMLVLPLYSLLDPAEQAKVFETHPPNLRVIIFSTNVAETSLTIPGVRYVVDSGLEKVRHFDYKAGVTNARIQYISQASADQRMGRAGRTAPGRCFRLYSAGMFQHAFPEHTMPDILKLPIEGVVLTIKSMGLEDVRRMPLPTPLDPDSLDVAERTLKHIGAIENKDRNPKITPTGRSIALFPFSPRISKIIVSGLKIGLYAPSVIAAAVLTVREPFDTPRTLQPGQKPSKAEYGDPIQLIDYYSEWRTSEDRVGVCRRYGLRFRAMEEIDGLCEQVRTLLKKREKPIEINLDIEPLNATFRALTASCIASGFPDRIAHLDDSTTGRYVLTDGRKAFLPGNSALSAKPPAFITFVDVVVSEERTRLLMATRIQSDALFTIGSPLLLTRGKSGKPVYEQTTDRVIARVEGTYSGQQWTLKPSNVPPEEPWGCFAAALISGRVFPSLRVERVPQGELDLLTAGTTVANQLAKLRLFTELKRANIASKAALKRRWTAEPSFLMESVQAWSKDAAEKNRIMQNWLQYANE